VTRSEILRPRGVNIEMGAVGDRDRYLGKLVDRESQRLTDSSFLTVVKTRKVTVQDATGHEFASLASETVEMRPKWREKKSDLDLQSDPTW
jgi:hypothetical protein